MFTTLETLTPPGIKDRGFGEYIFGPFTIMSTAWGSYYINGNLNSDYRENLRFTSNFGNLQTAVYKGSIRAVYDITETAVGNPIDAVLEQNDYYAFGCRIETPDLLQPLRLQRKGDASTVRTYHAGPLLIRWLTVITTPRRTPSVGIIR